MQLTEAAAGTAFTTLGQLLPVWRHADSTGQSAQAILLSVLQQQPQLLSSAQQALHQPQQQRSQQVGLEQLFQQKPVQPLPPPPAQQEQQPHFQAPSVHQACHRCFQAASELAWLCAASWCWDLSAISPGDAADCHAAWHRSPT